jgi:acyl dehydratase
MGEGTPSHLGALVRLLWQSARARGRGADPLRLPRGRIAVERRGLSLGARRLARYLAATRGAHIPAFQGARALLPPVAPALWETALLLELLAVARLALPAGGLIHTSSELVCVRALRAAEPVRCRLVLERAEPDARGVRLTVRSQNWNPSGQLASESTFELLARSRERGAGTARTRPERAASTVSTVEDGAWHELARWRLRGRDARRYARASRDYNPVHLWAWTARPFGFRRPILHGFCLEALVAHALIERRFAGDAMALRRLRIAFQRPLLLPAKAVLRIREGGAFRVESTEAGRARIYAEGEFAGG